MTPTTNSTARRRRTALAITAILVIIALCLGGTFAWQLIVGNEHKTNRAGDDNEKIYDVTLVEDSINYTANWRVGQVVNKSVSVVNNGDVLNNGYSAYVRISVKEYFEYADATDYVQTMHRYAVYDGVRPFFAGEVTQTTGNNNGKGRFVMFSSRATAEAAFPNNTVAMSDILTDTTSADLFDTITGDGNADGDPNEYWFVRTQYGDDDGEYGKFMTVKTQPGELIKIDDTKNRVSEGDLIAVHNEPHNPGLNPNGECDYTPVHIFDANASSMNAAFRRWVQLNITAGNFQPLSTWNGQPIAKWLYDDTTAATPGGPLTHPYLYWGQFLAPGESTLNALDSIELVRQPGGTFFYANHVDLEAVSIDELVNGTAWDGSTGQDLIPEIIKQSFVDYAPAISINPDIEIRVEQQYDAVQNSAIVISPALSSRYTKANIIWVSSAESVASVSATGIVTGESLGTAVITGILPSGERDSFTVAVLPCDCHIEHNGFFCEFDIPEAFFQVMDMEGNIYYTKSACFVINEFGNVTQYGYEGDDPISGLILLGLTGDPTGCAAASQRINVAIDIPSCDLYEYDEDLEEDVYVETTPHVTLADLDRIYVDEYGVIKGEHYYYGTLLLGRVDVAVFEYPEHLAQDGEHFTETFESGPPTIWILEDYLA